MKILFITNEIGEKSGWARYSLDLIESLMEKGNEVTVICNKINPKYSHIDQKQLLCEPLEFKKIFFLSPFFLFRIVKTIRNDFSLVYCAVETYLPLAFLASFFYKKPYFCTIHGSFALKTLSNPLLRIFQKIFYKKASQIISISKYTRDRLFEFILLKNVSIISNGVGERFLKEGAKSDAVEKRVHEVIGVGALKNRKGFHLCVQVIAKVAQRIPDISYTMIGSGNDKSYVDCLRKLIEEERMSDKIHFLHGIADEDLISLYRRCGAYLMLPISSRYDFEGFGLVYLEANAFGLPVIGSKGNGGEDAIKDGETGFLVDPEDIEQASQRLYTLLSDEGIRKEMSVLARSWARENSWSRITDRYLELFKRHI